MYLSFSKLVRHGNADVWQVNFGWFHDDHDAWARRFSRRGPSLWCKSSVVWRNARGTAAPIPGDDEERRAGHQSGTPYRDDNWPPEEAS